MSRDGKVLFAQGYGHANEELSVPNATDTKFRLGSITKQFTAASILLLQERGRLCVSDRILSNRATGYSSRNGVRINSDYLDMTVPYAAGSLYSTVDDLMTWTEALFSGKLLPAKSLDAMLTVNLGGYAYGVGVSRMHNRSVVSHAGGINGFSTQLSRFPEDRVTIVVLRNADYGMPVPERIVQSLAAIVFGETYQLPSAE